MECSAGNMGGGRAPFVVRMALEGKKQQLVGYLVLRMALERRKQLEKFASIFITERTVLDRECTIYLSRKKV